MNIKTKLTKDMTEQQFDTNYWYADEIKSFARGIGIPDSSKLRKDELEELIKIYLRTKKIGIINRKNIMPKGSKDFELGLKLSLPIINYSNNKKTKNFIEQEALKINPTIKKKSGASYRLNRWREEQISNGKMITYGDLVKMYIKLNEREEPFKRIPSGRYINYLSDYLANEKDATRKDGIKVWKKLKELNIPKDYKSWNNFNE
ncbi:MAG: hypothetical protein V1720_15085 [bacterium]